MFILESVVNTVLLFIVLVTILFEAEKMHSVSAIRSHSVFEIYFSALLKNENQHKSCVVHLVKQAGYIDVFFVFQ